MQNNSEQEAGPQLSKEEIAQKREEITEFYRSNIGHLEVQVKYENLLAEIEEARARRTRAQMFMAQLFADSNPETDSANESNEEMLEEAPRRSLKRN